MTKEDLRNTKICLSSEDDRRKFQEHCFKLGIRWASGDKEIKHLESAFYFIGSDLELTKKDYNALFFIEHAARQIFLDDVLSIPTEYKFEPFERVLVRDINSEKWRASLFSHLDNELPLFKYFCVGGCWVYCIPYKGNEHLLGTTKDAE